MTDTDTTREAVERLAATVEQNALLAGHKRAAATLRALLARAERAEAERDAAQRDLRLTTAQCGDWQRQMERAVHDRDAARAEEARLRAEVHTLSTTCGHCGDLERAWAEAGRLRGTLTWVLNDVQAWCDAIAENGAGWDYWDDYYKSFKWGGIEKARAALAMKEPGHE